MDKIARGILENEMQELRDKLVSLGNITKIRMEFASDSEEVKVADEWEHMLDRFFDEVGDLARENGLLVSR